MLIGPSLWQKMQGLPTRYPSRMPKRPKTQKTPKGAEIPVPTRKEVYEALERAAKGKSLPKP